MKFFQDQKPKRKQWTVEEDELIISVVKDCPSNSWAEISRLLGTHKSLQTRTSKQCRQRWQNQLDPSLNKAKWTNEELLLLFTAHSHIGNKWTEVRSFIPNRSKNSIKKEFYSCIRKQFRKWKGHEPQVEHIQKYAHKLALQLLTTLKKKEKKDPEVAYK